MLQIYEIARPREDSTIERARCNRAAKPMPPCAPVSRRDVPNRGIDTPFTVRLAEKAMETCGNELQKGSKLSSSICDYSLQDIGLAYGERIETARLHHFEQHEESGYYDRGAIGIEPDHRTPLRQRHRSKLVA